MKDILIAMAIVGGLGCFIGLLLGVVSKIFAVKTDPKVTAVREALPGNNCGGCGYAGCDGLAEAIAKGEAPVSGCPVGGAETAAVIGKIMGKEATFVRKVAYVKCSGTCDQAKQLYHYYGATQCHQVAQTPGRGSKACAYGCLGFGSCVQVCEYDAIHVVNGCAKVDKERCAACGKCVQACPHGLIELIPYEAPYAVQCSAKEKGKAVRTVCSAGCIGCGVCEKSCPVHAITVRDNIARIDYDLCTGCGTCVEKCPVKVIRSV